MTVEEKYEEQLNVVKDLIDFFNKEGEPCSIKWAINAVMATEAQKNRAERDIIRYKRKRIIKKILKNNE